MHPCFVAKKNKVFLYRSFSFGRKTIRHFSLPTASEGLQSTDKLIKKGAPQETVLLISLKVLLLKMEKN